MSDSVYQVTIALVLGAALIVQVAVAVSFFRRREWGQLRRLALIFFGWLVTTLLLFLIGVGICAAGCPQAPFEFIFFMLICAPSVFVVYRLFKRSGTPPKAAG